MASDLKDFKHLVNKAIALFQICVNNNQKDGIQKIMPWPLKQ